MKVAEVKETPKVALERIDKLIAKHKGERWPLIPLVEEIQREVGYIPK